MTNGDHDRISIKVDLNPSHKNDEIVRQALHEFNVKQIGKDEHYSIFAFNQQNEIIGGALVYTETRSIFIDILWVKESERAKNPEWLVMVGVCTHLGCVPLGDKGDYKAWFCPCHGSHYDSSGRVRKGPAPKNLEIPKYEFIDNKTIKIG